MFVSPKGDAGETVVDALASSCNLKLVYAVMFPVFYPVYSFTSSVSSATVVSKVTFFFIFLFSTALWLPF